MLYAASSSVSVTRPIYIYHIRDDAGRKSTSEKSTAVGICTHANNINNQSVIMASLLFQATPCSDKHLNYVYVLYSSKHPSFDPFVTKSCKNASIIFAMPGRMEQLNGKKDFQIICFWGILLTSVGIPVLVYNNRHTTWTL
jgi:hypothetical protein